MSENESKYVISKKKQASDYVLAVVRAGIAVIPFGGAVNELLPVIIQPSLHTRMEQWFDLVGHSLEDLLKRVENLEQITSNDNFIDVAIQASRIALTTTKQVKLEALKNVVINSAISTNFDQFKYKVFMCLLDQFDEYHILFLKLLYNPTLFFKSANIDVKKYFYNVMPSLSFLIELAFPELKNNEQFCTLIWNDLFSKNLINTKDFYGTMPFDGIMAKRTTELGDDFLNFISESKIEQ
jgi:hypothetical protein